MDPITALNVAGAIVQFVDFGIRVVSKGYQIYRSESGATSEHHNLGIIANDLLILQTKLNQAVTSHRTTDADDIQDDRAIEDVRSACQEVAAKLQQRLSMAKAQGRYRRWKSLRQALKSVSSKKEVDEMAARMGMLRDQLQFHVLIRLRQKLDLAAIQQSSEYNALDMVSKEILKAFYENRDVFSRDLESFTSTLLSRQDRSDLLIIETGDRIITSIEWNMEKRNALNAGGWESKCQEKRISRANFSLGDIICSLHFPCINDRHEAVAEAHAKTFSWIFKDPSVHNKPWDNFVLWLQSGTGIYWIKGKAASGKSTLMKFLLRQPTVRENLSLWTRRAQLICPSFFFWNIGTQLQKSQIGLLRSLLHQILSRRRSLNLTCVRELWDETIIKEDWELRLLRDGKYPWSLPELKHMLNKIIKIATSDTDFCFFVDGLDEFDGDHMEIVAFFKELSQFPNVKLCLSSRPLMVFENEFNGCPKLRLQDLTMNDIEAYVRDKFIDNERVSQLAREEPGLVSQLVDEIAQTSSGVFLWITLVVKSLLQGVTNHDRTIDLQRRLKELPPELDELYSLMLRSIKPSFYIEQASRLLQIVYQSRFPLSALALSFADDENESLPLEMVFKFISSAERCRREQEISARLKSRCAGLLEVSRGFDGLTVQYLHLTVKEFLEKPAVWSALLKYTARKDFDASTSLLRSTVSLIKACAPRDKIPMDLVVESMRYALQAESGTGKAQVELLDELDLCLGRFSQSPDSGDRHWSALLSHGYVKPESFLTFAISQGLVLYSKAKLSCRTFEINYQSGKPLLTYATLCRPLYGQGNDIQPSMVAMLLQASLDPNQQFRWMDRELLTPWQVFLQKLSERKEVRGNPPDSLCLDICKLYVLHGADVNAFIHHAAKNTSALEIIETAFGHLPRQSVEDLRTMMIQRGAKIPADFAIVRGTKRRSGSSEYGHNTTEGPRAHPFKSQKSNRNARPWHDQRKEWTRYRSPHRHYPSSSPYLAPHHRSDSNHRRRAFGREGERRW